MIRNFCQRRNGQMYEIQTSFNIEIVRYESSVINIVISIISNDTFYEYF